MKFSKFLLTGVAAIALVACGKKDDAADAPKSEASAKASKADAASPLAGDFKLKNAEEIDVDSFFAVVSPEEAPTYDASTFDKDLGATVVTNLRFSDADDGEAILVKRAEFYGVDMDAIERVKTSSETGNDGAFETVFQKVRLLDITAEGIEDGNGSVNIGGVEFDTLAIRQGGIKNNDDDNPAHFFNAISLAGLYFKDVSFDVAEEDAPAVRFSAPDLRFVGMSGGKLEAFIAKDLEYEMTQGDEAINDIAQAMGPQGAMVMNSPLRGLVAPENQRTLMKTLEWRDIDFSGLMAWGLKDEQPPMSEKDLIDLGTFKATDMTTSINGKQLATIEEATMSAAEFTWLIPSKIRADTKGAVYDFTAYVPEEETATIDILNEHKLNSVKSDGYAEWVWNEGSGIAELDYVANTEGFADFSMALGFSNLKMKDLQAASEEGAENPFATNGAFQNFSLKLKDEKALDALFAVSALQMGGSGDDLRQSAPAMIRLSGAQFAQMNPRFSSYIDAMADFIAKGGSLEISAKPEDPLAFSALQSGEVTPQTLPDALNLTVTHEE